MSKKRAELRRQGTGVDVPWTPFLRATATNVPAGYEDYAKDLEMYLNSRYQVVVRHLDNGVTHLSIHDLERSTRHDWRDFQRIKNELCGPEREAVEIYPAEHRLIDTSNEYHLWVFEENCTLSLGFHSGRTVRDDLTLGNSKQRPIH